MLLAPPEIFSLFACWFQPGLISQPTMFFSHNKPAPAGLISPETNQRTARLLLPVFALKQPMYA